MFREMVKLGKKLWFPDAPSNWVGETVKTIIGCQNPLPKSRILFPFPRYNIAKDKEDDQLYDPPAYTKVADDDESFYGYSWCHVNSFELWQYFRTRSPKYSDSINDKTGTVVIEEGKPFDVISWLSTVFGDEKGYLLRNNGDAVKVESLRGKNILVCCQIIPSFWQSHEVFHLRALPFACSLVNYELVLVPKLVYCDENDDDDDEDAFNHFISGLPSSALVVPFSETQRRDFLCKSLNLVSSPKYLIVEESQNVLSYTPEDYSVDILSPFTNYNMTGISWWKAHSQLDEILDCKPSDFVYSFSNPEGVSISEIKEKLVGLYLCIDGRSIRPLNLIYEECKARNLEFEIVLVYIPYIEAVNPQLFQEAINQVLHQMHISTWWTTPFNDFVSYRLWQVCNHCIEDQLIMVGPHGKFVDPYGNQVITNYGINAYPFTREHLVDRELEALRALTVESLLMYGSHDYLLFTRRDLWNALPEFNKFPVAQVQGKTVILYVDYLKELNFTFYFPLLKWYYQFKKTKPPPPLDFEVVFFDLDGGDFRSSGAMLMPWLLCPFDPQHAALLEKTLLKGRRSIIVAFGKDGKIRSLNAQDLLESYGPDDFEFYGDLRNELIENIQMSCDDGSA